MVWPWFSSVCYVLLYSFGGSDVVTNRTLLDHSGFNMTPQLSQISSWMTAQHRCTRFAPQTKIPPLERADCITLINQAARTLAQATRVSGAKHDFATANSDSLVDPVEVYTALTFLHAQVLAAYHTYGMPAAEGVGIYELTRTDSPKDFKKALETFYPTK